MYAHASKGPNFYKESFFDVESCKANQDFFYLDDGPITLCAMGIGYLESLSNRNQADEVLVVGIDYFTKWVETKPLAKITQ